MDHLTGATQPFSPIFTSGEKGILALYVPQLRLAVLAHFAFVNGSDDILTFAPP